MNKDIIHGNYERLADWAESCIREILNGKDKMGTHLLFLVNIDNLRVANGQQGYLTDNKVMDNLTQAITSIFRATDVICRIGSNEFIILMRNVAHRDVVYSKSQELILALQMIIRNSVEVLGLSSSIGVSICENGDHSFEEMFDEAQRALYVAKNKGRNRFMIWGDTQTETSKSFQYSETDITCTEGEFKRILVADDDMYFQKLLRKALGKAYIVETASNGAQALEMLKQSDYALLIVDIQMPVKTGWDVLKTMREDNEMREIPVIVITSDNHPESEVKALNLGATDVIVKPFVVETLLSRVQNTIARREARIAEEQNRLYEIQLNQQKKLLQLAERDDLTGLYNRKAFIRIAERMIKEKPDVSFVISCLNIDGFKLINDRFSFAEGDRLLKYVAKYVMTPCVDEDYPICRDVADNFIVLLPFNELVLHERETEIPVIMDGYDLSVNISMRIGRYLVVEPDIDVNLMIDRAYIAQRTAKGVDGVRIVWYDTKMRQRIIREKELTDAMRPALRSGQFEVWFQPQYEYPSQNMIGAEALVRWRHPEKGLISPGEFVPLFEKNGLIYELDKFVWEQSCRYMRKWLDAGYSQSLVSVSVNISRIDLYDADFVDSLLRMVKRNGLSPSSLRLEITESAYIDNSEQLIEVVTELRKAGFSVEMDDFGSGYSSLNMLKDVPVDVLKLDMCFLPSDRDDLVGSEILGAIIRMAQAINRKVIAEGVETRDYADYLNNLGCRYMQGYYFSRPIPAEKFEQLLIKETLGVRCRI